MKTQLLATRCSREPARGFGGTSDFDTCREQARGYRTVSQTRSNSCCSRGALSPRRPQSTVSRPHAGGAAWLQCVVLLAALVLALPLQATDLSQLIADTTKYESGQSVEPLRKFEELLRDSARKPSLRAELEAAMIRLLAPTSTFEARRFACQQLAVIGTDASLPALAELLKNEETAGIACLALGSRQSPKIAETLRNALPAARGRIRLQIISTLGNQQDKQSVKPLAELARDSDAGVASAAILALGKIGGREAHAVIAALRKEKNPAIAFAVAEATLRVAEQTGSVALYQEMLAASQPANIRRGAFSALLRLDKDGGEKRIVETLRGRDALLEPIAIAAVGTLKSRGASEKFTKEMSSLIPQQQAWMVEALATRGDAAARAAIRNAVGSSNAIVRFAAFAALGRLNDGTSAPLLCAALAKAQDADERQEIVNALGQITGAATDKAILAELKRATGEARCELIGLAGRRGNRAAVPVLFEETASDDAATAKAAFQALGKVAGADDLAALLAKLTSLKTDTQRDAAENAAMRVLAKINDPAQRTAAVGEALSKTSDCEARCSLLRLMPACGCPKALATLSGALKDSDTRIRETAMRTLADWPDLAVWDTLTGICGQQESETFRALALRGLVRLATSGNAKPDAALIGRYRQLLDIARSDNERKLVLGALAGVAHPDALPLVYPLLEVPGVRAEAVQAVNRIAYAVRTTHPEAQREAAQRLKASAKKK